MWVTKKDLEALKVWQLTKQEENLTKFQREVDILRQDLKNLSDKANSINTDLKLSTTLSSRLDELELWKGKIHGLLVEETPSGREKLSPLAKLKKRGYI